MCNEIDLRHVDNTVGKQLITDKHAADRWILSGQVHLQLPSALIGSDQNSAWRQVFVEIEIYQLEGWDF